MGNATLDLANMKTAPKLEDVVAAYKASTGTYKEKCWLQAYITLLTQRNVCFTGVPGTGKTYSVCQFLDLVGMPWVRPPLHETSSADELRGHAVQVIDETTGNTKFVTHIGSFVDAYMHGKAFIGDEFNRASPEVHSFCFPGLDGSDITIDIIGEGVRQVKMHPNFRFICMSNDDFYTFPAGLQRRFHGHVEITDLAPGLWAKIPNELKPLVRATAFHENDEQRITGAEWELIISAARRVKDLEIAVMTVKGPAIAKEIAAQYKVRREVAQR